MMMVNARAAGVVHAIRWLPVAWHAVAPWRAATSSAGTSGVTPGAGAIGWPNHPSRDLHHQVTSESLPYCILRRMSTDVSQT